MALVSLMPGSTSLSTDFTEINYMSQTFNMYVHTFIVLKYSCTATWDAIFPTQLYCISVQDQMALIPNYDLKGDIHILK